MSRWFRVSVFVVALSTLFPLQRILDARRPELPSSLLYMPDRRLMKVIAFGHGPTVADLVWIQSTNYIMEEFKDGVLHIQHLYDLYDVMTELDPEFVDAYVTGGVFLSSIAQEPELSLELLEKGNGRLDDRGDSVAPVTSGRVSEANKERWKILGEMAATHLVSLAAFAPTLEERYQEIHTAGRLYAWGAKRYPLAQYPDRPKWWDVLGPALASRQIKGSRSGWYDAAKQVWYARLLYTPRSSPLYRLYERRLNEVVARQIFDSLENRFARWKEAHGGRAPEKLSDLAAKVPEDPLGVGFFIVAGELVAPALDAELTERQLGRDATTFRRRIGRAPASLDELRAFQEKEGRAPAIPAWVTVTWDTKAAEARASAHAPR